MTRLLRKMKCTQGRVESIIIRKRGSKAKTRRIRSRIAMRRKQMTPLRLVQAQRKKKCQRTKLRMRPRASL